MKTTLRIVLLTLGVLAVGSGLAAQPPAGSQLPKDENLCVMCHGEPALWEEDTARLHVPLEGLAEDVHWLAGVNCHDCHGGNPTDFNVPTAHATEVDDEGSGIIAFRPLDEIREVCFQCHEEQKHGLDLGVHGESGQQEGETREAPRDCRTCHGDAAHGILSSDNARSPVFLDNQIQLCGGCHEESLETYNDSVHGHGLHRSGLKVTAVCSSCHGAHGIYAASEEQSTLHATHVAATCAACHRFIQERLKESVHGRGNGPGEASEEAAPGGDVMRRPSCTDCHQGHDLPHPDSARFRLRLANRCGDCHTEMSSQYAMSMHGALTDLGYGQGAKCSDCHGAHDILPMDDPGSQLAVGENRIATCRKCHPRAGANFCDFLPHADYKSHHHNPVLHAIYLSMELLIYSVFAFFGVHTILWFVRSLMHIREHGRPAAPKASQPGYVRFEPIHRVMHAVVIVSFLGLALTGLPLRYSGQPWAQTLARVLGGFESTSVWHHIFGVVTVGYFVVHLLWMAGRVFTRLRQGDGLIPIFFGPDSPIPTPRDLLDMWRMFRWFVGRGPKPGFERWTYWEKFDYWAVFWGVGIIGTSGLVLWFPDLFCLILPGAALNVAKIIHSEEALLATGFIFSIHFFNTHFRPEKFPMDVSLLTGYVTEEELKEERPDHYERLRQAGKLEEAQGTVPPKYCLWVTRAAGALALAVGLALLVGMLLAIFGG